MSIVSLVSQIISQIRVSNDSAIQKNPPLWRVFMLLALGIASFLTSAAIAKNPRDLQSPALGLWQVLDWPKGD